MDWVTLTRDQVDRDELPRICIVCGEPATKSVNKTFSYRPPWVEYLYFAGIFPGLIAEHMYSQEMRVSCPVCQQHGNHWSRLAWVASVGWLLAVPFALVVLAACKVSDLDDDWRTLVFVAAGAGLGLAIWLAIVIRFAVTTIKVSKISSSGDEITLHRVSDAFAKSAGVTKEPPGASERDGCAEDDPDPPVRSVKEMRNEKVNLSQKLEQFDERWGPRIVGELNGQQVKLAKLEGEFVWHHHEEEDELFMVLRGRLQIHLRERTIELDEGEFFIVPRGVEHKPVAAEEVHVLILEPSSTLNTGNVRNERTVDDPERL